MAMVTSLCLVIAKNRILENGHMDNAEYSRWEFVFSYLWFKDLSIFLDSIIVRIVLISF